MTEDDDDEIGMTAVFYDRRNNREVTSKQLMPIRYMRRLMHYDEDDEKPVPGPDEMVGDLGYKSETCPENRNWDTWTNLSDLVFLRLE